jgi:hypothetical protein
MNLSTDEIMESAELGTLSGENFHVSANIDTYGRAYRSSRKRKRRYRITDFLWLSKIQDRPITSRRRSLTASFKRLSRFTGVLLTLPSFSTRTGVVACSALKDIKRVLMTLDGTFYESLRKVVEKNFQITKNYANWHVSAATALHQSISEHFS